MERSSSIFYKMTAQNENSTTELLCNLFRIKYFRDICLDYFGIERKFIDEIALEKISSQNSTDDSGQPDIVIKTDNIIYYIENKILLDTGLQEKQKNNYAENLLKFRNTQGKHIGYIFLIPKGYVHEKEIDEIINKYNFTRKYYWQDFLSFLYNKELHIESPIIKEGLNYFDELVQGDKPLDTVLNPREVVMLYNPEKINDVLNLMVKIRETIKSSLKIVVDKIGNDYSWGGEQNDQWGQGGKLNYKNRLSIFVGITPYLYGEEEGIFFYSVALLKKYLVENYKIDDSEFKHCEDDEWVCIAIDKDLFVEDEKEKLLADEIIKILKNVFEKNYKG